MSVVKVKDKQAEGYDVSTVEAWIDEYVEGLVAPFEWTRLEGGHSNITYQLQDAAGKKAVIRRPPLGELLPGAHDMRREWELISCLGPPGFPVPAALGFCADKDVTGAFFYVMGFIEGHPLYNSTQTLERIPLEKRVILAHSFFKRYSFKCLR